MNCPEKTAVTYHSSHQICPFGFIYGIVIYAAKCPGNWGAVTSVCPSLSSLPTWVCWLYLCSLLHWIGYYLPEKPHKLFDWVELSQNECLENSERPKKKKSSIRCKLQCVCLSFRKSSVFFRRPGFCLVLRGGSLLMWGVDCEFSRAGLILGITSPGIE